MSVERSALINRLLERMPQEVSTHAVVLLDVEGTIVAWLAGSQRLFGYSAEEIVGENVAILFTPEDLQKGLATWEQRTASAAGESEDDRWQVRKDGGKIWVSGTLTSLHDEQGQLIGFAKIMRNRTDQRSQVQSLKSRISLLQQADQRKNTFIATLAHELRSPLAALSNATELLRGCESISADLALTVGILRRQVEFMGKMVDDLLEVTRMAAGKIELRKERVSLQEILQHAIETCRAAISKRGQTLNPLMPSIPIYLDADPLRLRQVFINLIENAAKYTPDGGTIRVKASAEGNEAVARISDDGIGIAPDVMPHIFGLFTQATITGSSPGGLGIGLSVVKENVEMHGGSVQAASDGLGKGSEFSVRLPLPRTSS